MNNVSLGGILKSKSGYVVLLYKPGAEIRRVLVKHNHKADPLPDPVTLDLLDEIFLLARTAPAPGVKLLAKGWKD